MKLREIIEAVPAFQKLSAAELPFRKLYSIDKLLNGFDLEIKFFNEERSKIIKKYEDDGQIKTENLDAVNREIDKLLDTDVNVKYKKIILSFEDDIKLSRNDMISLDKFAEFVFSEKKEEEKEDK